MFDIVALGLAAAAAWSAPIYASVVGPDGEKVVCRRSVPTGSMMSTDKICRTSRDWEQPLADRALDGDDVREEPLFFGRTAKANQTMQVGSANWAKMPALKAKPSHLPYRQLVTAVEIMLKRKECRLPGQSARAFDITVPFALLVEPNGTANRVLVGSQNCAPLETLVGMIALARSERGDFLVGGQNKPRWYAGSANFTLL